MHPKDSFKAKRTAKRREPTTDVAELALRPARLVCNSLHASGTSFRLRIPLLMEEILRRFRHHMYCSPRAPNLTLVICHNTKCGTRGRVQETSMLGPRLRRSIPQ